MSVFLHLLSQTEEFEWLQKRNKPTAPKLLYCGLDVHTSSSRCRSSIIRCIAIDACQTGDSRLSVLPQGVVPLLLLLLVRAQTVVAADSTETDDHTNLCRANLLYLPPKLFAKHTCALCYNFHPGFYQKSKWSLAWKKAVIGNSTFMYHVLWNSSMSDAVEADFLQPDLDLLSTFVRPEDVAKWIDCCQNAVSCCHRMIAAAGNTETDWCPPTWDGWQCWQAAAPGSTATAVCPDYVYFDNTPHCDHYATKECEHTGRWFTILNSRNQTREWSDYGPCKQLTELLRRVYVHVTANAVSIVALVPALIIFFSYRQLNVHRVSIHKNFFMSLLLNSVMVIVFKCVVILDELKGGSPSIVQQNGIGCKLLFLLTKYCRLTNYLWQFCEGFYLHKLIASAFAEQKSLLVFYLIGWGKKENE
ncbi:Calcitonin receptor [Amphibalanus amphitrite]|uniref:Calcitonin receptor n=1 Tax=Amphibalanus amphitrite TaxID=1232801 RepID=A0A6A4WHJ7_AMPAM|nr:Calcitonin receptor [Amphibalanus amphitrite]